MKFHHDSLIENTADFSKDKYVTNNESLGSILQRLRSGKLNPLRALFLGMDAVFVFVVVKLFSGLAYDRKYLTGRWFEKIWSPGWRWAFNGMFSKLFTGHGRGIPWPISMRCNCTRNIEFHPDQLNLFCGGSYYQALDGAKITIGRGVWIARGSALITSNHNPNNPDVHLEPKSIEIGDHCWLGTNVVVLPGVKLGPYTTVGANAVVTHSFPDGHCVIAGVPARIVRELTED